MTRGFVEVTIKLRNHEEILRLALLVGRSFETSTVPNLKFPNYDSVCERSYWDIYDSIPCQNPLELVQMSEIW